jgi:hypothetical protein
MSRQSVLNPHWHLIPLLVYPGVSVCSLLGFAFTFRLMRLMTVIYATSNLDILINIDYKGRLTTTLDEKPDDCDFVVVNFPFLCINIPRIVCISAIWLNASCIWKLFKSKRGKLSKKKFMLQVYNESRLKSLFCRFYGCNDDFFCDNKFSLAHTLNYLFHTLC